MVACGDDPQVRLAVADADVPVVLYGEGQGNRAVVSAIAAHEQAGISFVLTVDGEQVACGLPIAGRHNALNAAAALLMARAAGVPLAQGATLLADYRGVQRRSELKGEAQGWRWSTTMPTTQRNCALPSRPCASATRAAG